MRYEHDKESLLYEYTSRYQFDAAERSTNKLPNPTYDYRLLLASLVRLRTSPSTYEEMKRRINVSLLNRMHVDDGCSQIRSFSLEAGYPTSIRVMGASLSYTRSSHDPSLFSLPTCTRSLILTISQHVNRSIKPTIVYAKRISTVLDGKASERYGYGEQKHTAAPKNHEIDQAKDLIEPRKHTSRRDRAGEETIRVAIRTILSIAMSTHYGNPNAIPCTIEAAGEQTNMETSTHEK
ncbi:hypothetical protein BJ508DRAFT_307613 [Ascobolus immersus RN42]|uniref:Uncharacterized protein n=1 Tax=Ascobolus immersus RN42 TaxID=1160509 RepID=A0A3N4I4B4_ASCIM|nr:hypothetical protein BJ508DRAFT_307613 [Ascobolus immersus RN42]